LVTVEKVVRQNGRAQKVIIDTGNVSVTYMLGQKGQLQEIGRSSKSQILSDQSLYIPPSDYRQVIKQAAAILKEKRRKAQ